MKEGEEKYGGDFIVKKQKQTNKKNHKKTHKQTKSPNPKKSKLQNCNWLPITYALPVSNLTACAYLGTGALFALVSDAFLEGSGRGELGGAKESRNSPGREWRGASPVHTIPPVVRCLAGSARLVTRNLLWTDTLGSVSLSRVFRHFSCAPMCFSFPSGSLKS